MFCPFSSEKKLVKTHKRVLHMANSDSHIDNSQCGRPKSAELLEVNENAGARNALTVRDLLTTKPLFRYRQI